MFAFLNFAEFEPSGKWIPILTLLHYFERFFYILKTELTDHNRSHVDFRYTVMGTADSGPSPK